MAKQSNDPSYQKHLALLALSVGAIALVSDTASAQRLLQRQQQEQSQVRRAAARIHPPERTKTKIGTTSVALPSPSIDGHISIGASARGLHSGCSSTRNLYASRTER